MNLFLLCFVMSIPIFFRTTYVQGIQVMQQISPAHSTSLKKHWPKIQKNYFSEKEWKRPFAQNSPRDTFFWSLLNQISSSVSILSTATKCQSVWSVQVPKWTSFFWKQKENSFSQSNYPEFKLIVGVSSVQWVNLVILYVT